MQRVGCSNPLVYDQNMNILKDLLLRFSLIRDWSKRTGGGGGGVWAGAF